MSSVVSVFVARPGSRMSTIGLAGPESGPLSWDVAINFRLVTIRAVDILSRANSVANLVCTIVSKALGR
jgi:hypothetical protein